MFLMFFKLYVGCKKVTTEVCNNCVPIFLGLPFESNSMCCICFPQSVRISDDMRVSCG